MDYKQLVIDADTGDINAMDKIDLIWAKKLITPTEITDKLINFLKSRVNPENKYSVDLLLTIYLVTKNSTDYLALCETMINYGHMQYLTDKSCYYNRFQKDCQLKMALLMECYDYLVRIGDNTSKRYTTCIGLIISCNLNNQKEKWYIIGIKNNVPNMLKEYIIFLYNTLQSNNDNLLKCIMYVNLAITKNQWYGHHYLGLLYFEKSVTFHDEHNEQAIIQFEKALDMYENHDTLNYLVDIYDDQKNYNKSYEYLLRSLKLDSIYAHLLYIEVNCGIPCGYNIPIQNDNPEIIINSLVKVLNSDYETKDHEKTMFKVCEKLSTDNINKLVKKLDELKESQKINDLLEKIYIKYQMHGLLLKYYYRTDKYELLQKHLKEIIFSDTDNMNEEIIDFIILHDLEKIFNNKVPHILRKFKCAVMNKLNNMTLHMRYTMNGIGYEEAKSDFMSAIVNNENIDIDVDSNIDNDI